MLWGVPGPRRFADHCEAGVRAGEHLVLRFPAGSGESARWELRRRLESDLVWRNVEPSAGGEPGIGELLQGFIAPEDVPWATARSLAESEDFEGYFIWVELDDASMAREWFEFVDEYRRSCLASSRSSASVFVLLLRGEAAEMAIRAEPGLRIVDWRAVWGRLDALLFAASILGDGEPPIRKEIRARLVSEVALFDPDLASTLVGLPLLDLFAPKGALIEYAAERGWKREQPASWSTGTEDVVDGASEVHSCIHALRGSKELSARLWRAEISVLLAFVEERRRVLLPRLSRWLRVPFANGDGKLIRRLEELELGHIWLQLSRHPESDRRLREHVAVLREVRNCLAHLQPLTRDLAARLLQIC